MARRRIHVAEHTTASGSVHSAKVYRDAEYDEYIVIFYAFGTKLVKEDYHTSDKADAIDTANYHIGRIAKQFA